MYLQRRLLWLVPFLTRLREELRIFSDAEGGGLVPSCENVENAFDSMPQTNNNLFARKEPSFECLFLSCLFAASGFVQFPSKQARIIVFSPFLSLRTMALCFLKRKAILNSYSGTDPATRRIRRASTLGGVHSSGK